jgi:hypothetical protein
VILDGLRAQEQGGGSLPGRTAAGQAQRDLEFLRGQVIEGGHVPPPRGLAGGGELGPRRLGPRGGAEVVEHVHRGAKFVAGPDPLPLAPQASTVGQVRAGSLEGVRGPTVQGQRGFEVGIGFALGGELPAASRGARHGPGLALDIGVAGEVGGYLGGLRSAPQTQVDLDQLRHRGQVSILDAARAQHGSLLLEMSQRGFGSPLTQLKVTQGGDGPHFGHAQAQLARQAQRLLSMRAALLRPAQPGFEPGGEGQRQAEVATLTGFPGQADRFVKAGLSLGPSIRAHLIDCDVEQHEGQRADRGFAAGRIERTIQQGSPDVRLAQPDRPHGRPGQQAGIVAEFVRALEHFDRLADGRRAGFVLAREDQRHAPRDQREERDMAVRVGRGERGDPFGGHEHGRGVARGKRRVRRLGEHHDGSFRIDRRGSVGGGQEDLLPFANRAAVDGDVAAEVLDGDGQARIGHVPG